MRGEEREKEKERDAHPLWTRRHAHIRDFRDQRTNRSPLRVVARRAMSLSRKSRSLKRKREGRRGRTIERERDSHSGRGHGSSHLCNPVPTPHYPHILSILLSRFANDQNNQIPAKRARACQARRAVLSGDHTLAWGARNPLSGRPASSPNFDASQRKNEKVKKTKNGALTAHDFSHHLELSQSTRILHLHSHN